MSLRLEDIRVVLAKKFPALYLFFKHVDVYQAEEISTGIIKGLAASTVVDRRLAIFLSEDFFEQNDNVQFAVILHELWHLILRHPMRAANFISAMLMDYQPAEAIHACFNIAADLKVDNYYLAKMEIYVKHLSPEDFDFTSEDVEKMSVEEMARKLLKSNNQKTKQLLQAAASSCPFNMPGSNGCSGGSSEDSESDSESGSDSSSQKAGSSISDLIPVFDKETIQQLIQQSRQLQKGQALDKGDSAEESIVKTFCRCVIAAKNAGGSISSVEERLLRELTKPKVNWRAILKKNLKSLTAGRAVMQSYTRINRRIDVLPGLRRLSIGRIFAFIDVSGSIEEKEYKQFMSEVAGMLNTVDEVRVIFWDTAVTGDYSVRKKSDVPRLKVRGGGGTTIVPILQQYIKQIKPQDIVIVLTDGCFFDNPEETIKKIKCTSKILVTTSVVHDYFDVKIKIS